MTNKEILQADLLDILFEHRNKLYGAYALRKTYTHRLGFALSIALSTVVVFAIFSFLRNDKLEKNPFQQSDPYIVSEVDMPAEEIKEPERRPEEPRPQPAQVDHQQIIIAPDDEADDIPDQETISRSRVSDINADGETAGDTATTVIGSGGIDSGAPKPVEENTQPVRPSRPPTFPGGTPAWLAFLQRYLQSPEELEPGQRIEVHIKFWIDIDGNISRPEIIKSGGNTFDKEVIRVLKKMPRWEPAIQNGNLIAVPYTQPVIFIGVEQ